ncbi:MAG TPA: glycerol-3-phosphate 1-O-acyltransferase PlsY [Acidobacteriota bacterium]|nr:glycerol-3-phosphate 1-O-acyltransferase PlsY [Acidobacteriota bacterium]
MTVRLTYLIPIAAYFLGSIPFGYLLTRMTMDIDIRSIGSGNIGATNVFRKNRWAGILTLVLDITKGFLAVTAARWMGGSEEWQAVAAAAAIAGHIFTVWLGFKGGKGVATGCGAYLALAPEAVGTTLVLFVLVVVLTRYISLASILATVAVPFWTYLYREPASVLIWAAIGATLIIAKHHQNIRRLLSGTERKFAFGNRPG